MLLQGKRPPKRLLQENTGTKILKALIIALFVVINFSGLMRNLQVPVDGQVFLKLCGKTVLYIATIILLTCIGPKCFAPGVALISAIFLTMALPPLIKDFV